MFTLRAFLFVALVLPMTAQAQMPAQFSLSYEPAVVRISLMPGSSYQGELRISNTSSETIRLNARAANFVPESEYGGVQLLPENKNPSPEDPISSSAWVNFPAGELVIAPAKTLRLPYIVQVPEAASPGAHSIALILDEMGGQVHAEFRALVFLDVPGDVKTDITIDDFSFSSFFARSMSNSFRIRVSNTGRTHIRPEGEIIIRDFFGRERDRFMLVDENGIGVIPPGSHRTLEYRLSAGEGARDLGLRFARLTITVGELRVSEYSVAFVVSMGVLFVSVLGLGGGFILLRISVAHMKRTHLLGGVMTLGDIAPIVFAGAIILVALAYIVIPLFYSEQASTLVRVMLGAR